MDGIGDDAVDSQQSRMGGPDGMRPHSGSLVGPENGTSTGDGDELEGSPTPMSDELFDETDRTDARFKVLAPVIVFDVVGPLAVYYGARGAGLSTVLSLVLSGVLPAARIGIIVIRHHRLDAIGALVLSGIALGTVVGLASGSARLYLLDGVVPTVALGLVCLVSLFSPKPMMYRLALETMGEDTERGQAFAKMRRYQEFQRIFKVITLVWGLVFLAESALQVVVVELASISIAKLTSNLLPVVVLVVTFAWTRAYGKRAERRGVTPEVPSSSGTP